jgi:hypothetical protein
MYLGTADSVHWMLGVSLKSCGCIKNFNFLIASTVPPEMLKNGQFSVLIEKTNEEGQKLEEIQ